MGSGNITHNLREMRRDPLAIEPLDWVEAFFNFIKTTGRGIFYSISYGIRVILDGLEVLFVQTPWPVIASFIILLTWLSAGFGAAIAAISRVVQNESHAEPLQ